MRVEVLGFGVGGFMVSGFGIQGFGFRVLGCAALVDHLVSTNDFGLESRAWGLGFGV